MQKCLQKQQHLQQVFVIPSSGPHDYIHLQKALGHIHNYHILMTQANSSYECYELKTEDRRRLRGTRKILDSLTTWTI
jgi:hypothetical protein